MQNFLLVLLHCHFECSSTAHLLLDRSLLLFVFAHFLLQSAPLLVLTLLARLGFLQTCLDLVSGWSYKSVKMPASAAHLPLLLDPLDLLGQVACGRIVAMHDCLELSNG